MKNHENEGHKIRRPAYQTGQVTRYAGREHPEKRFPGFLIMYVLKWNMSSIKRLYPENDMFFRDSQTTVYLIHLFEPIGRARHYLGSTDDLDRRLQEHRKKRTVYRLTGSTFNALKLSVPLSLLNALEPLRGREFRTKHTLEQAVKTCIGIAALEAYKWDIFKAARKSKGAALLQEANLRGIDWTVSQTWKANRQFEMWLKRKKQSFSRLCPLCHELPF